MFATGDELRQTIAQSIEGLGQNEAYVNSVAEFIEDAYETEPDQAMVQAMEYSTSSLEAISTHILNVGAQMSQFLDVQCVHLDYMNRKLRLVDSMMSTAKGKEGYAAKYARQKKRDTFHATKVMAPAPKYTSVPMEPYDPEKLDFDHISESKQERLSPRGAQMLTERSSTFRKSSSLSMKPLVKPLKPGNMTPPPIMGSTGKYSNVLPKGPSSRTLTSSRSSNGPSVPGPPPSVGRAPPGPPPTLTSSLSSSSAGRPKTPQEAKGKPKPPGPPPRPYP